MIKNIKMNMINKSINIKNNNNIIIQLEVKGNQPKIKNNDISSSSSNMKK